jgi:mannose-6-phosphate isomerase-like protein (cupin superfamily)
MSLPRADASQRIRNPITGDSLEFLASPLQGDAGPLVYRCSLAPNANGSPLHMHRRISETFSVEQGELSVEIGRAGQTRVLGPGDSVAIAPGQAHSFKNALDEPTVFVATVTPGAEFEKFLRTMYGLAADGRTNAVGMPTDPRTIALTLHYADLVLPNVPLSLQRTLIGSLVHLARWTRIERAFARYWPAAGDAAVLA